MNVISQLLKKHPVAIIFQILFTLLCIRTALFGLQFQERVKQHPGISGLAAGGEAIAYANIFLVIVAGIFFLINSGYAIAKQKETGFYLFMILIVIVETIAVFHIR